MNREQFLLRERDLAKKRSTITLLSAKLLPWLEGFFSILDEVVGAARAVLDKAQKDERIRGWRVYAFADDLHTQVNTFGLGLCNPEIHLLPCRRRPQVFVGPRSSGTVGHLGARA
jgi:hypothetical protein